MKPDTFDFKFLLAFFPATIIPLHSPHMLLNKKKSENSLSLEELREDEIKPERNITYLNLS